jgi:diguanylate cyclase (GGDEF)-like protein
VRFYSSHIPVPVDDGRISKIISALPRWLHVDRRLGVLDIALFSTSALMVLTGLADQLFHVIFVLLTVGALYWRFIPFAIRSLVWVTVTLFLDIFAVYAGKMKPEELLEIPLLTMILILVFLIASERSKVQNQLAHLSLHDALTRLPNRLLFVSRLHEALALRGPRDEAIAILYLDLDGFKAVNDTLGHEAGDALLIAASERFRRCVRENDTVARLGGDEFAILLRGTDIVAATATAERLVAAMGEPFPIYGHQVQVTTSVGIALSYSSTAAQDVELLKQADTALYRAKAVGKSQFAIYPPPVAA